MRKNSSSTICVTNRCTIFSPRSVPLRSKNREGRKKRKREEFSICELRFAIAGRRHSKSQIANRKSQIMTEKLPESSLRLGLPSGSLQNATAELFGKAGYRVSIADRSVFPRVE